MSNLSDLVNLERYPLDDWLFVNQCKANLEREGVLALACFVQTEALSVLKTEAIDSKHLAYFCSQAHTVYLSAPDPQYPDSHCRNIQIVSSKGCVTDDQVSHKSALRTIYNSDQFKKFLCDVLDEPVLYPYADPLSSINVHYYETGQELGWHFDNSSFAITLTIQAPETGGELEYIRQLRNMALGDMNYGGVQQVLDGKTAPKRLTFTDGMLVLFRGKDTLHRVTPVQGKKDRIQVVLAYNCEPGRPLSEEARRTFYGRVA